MSAVTGLPALDNTMGALFLGILLAGALWGATCMQTYQYFDQYSKDPWHLKATVIIVFILDTVHQVLISHISYTYLITQYGNPAFLGVIVWSIIAQVLVSAFIGLVVQSFFVWRIWTLSRHNILMCGLIMLLVFGEFAVSVAYFVKGWSLLTFVEITKLEALSRSVNALGLAGDVAISGALIFLLHRSKTGFASSDTMVNRLILFSLNTGLLTSVCALMSLITITVLPTTFIYMAFYAPLGRLYTNSLLATLNARKSIREGTGTSMAAMSLGQINPQRSHDLEVAAYGSKVLTSSKTGGQHPLNIQVNTETRMSYDPSTDSVGSTKKQKKYLPFQGSD